MMAQQPQQRSNNSYDDITTSSTITVNATNDNELLCTIQSENENNKGVVVVTTTSTTTATATNKDDNNNKYDTTCNYQIVETTATTGSKDTNDCNVIHNNNNNNNDSAGNQKVLNYHTTGTTSISTDTKVNKLHSLILLQGPDNNTSRHNNNTNNNNNNLSISVSDEINYIISLPLLEGENWLQLPTTTTIMGSSLSNNNRNNNINSKNRSNKNNGNDDTSTSTTSSSSILLNENKNLPKILSMSSSGTMSPSYSPINNNTSNLNESSNWMCSSTEASVPDDSAFNCFLCLDVDGTYVTIKDMRMSLTTNNQQHTDTDHDNSSDDNNDDDDDETCSDWIVSLVRGGRRRRSRHRQQLCNTSLQEQEEKLHRRQLRILYHKDIIIVRRRRRQRITNKNSNNNLNNNNNSYYEEFIFQHIYDDAIKLESTQPTICTTTDITSTSISTSSQPNEVQILVPTQYLKQQQQQQNQEQDQWQDNNNNNEIITIDNDHVIDLADTGPLLTQPNENDNDHDHYEQDDEQYKDDSKSNDDNNINTTTTATTTVLNTNLSMLFSDNVGLHQQQSTTNSTTRTLTLENENYYSNDNDNDMTIDNDNDNNHTDYDNDIMNDDDTTVDPDNANEQTIVETPYKSDAIHIDTNNNNNIVDIANPKCVNIIVSKNLKEGQVHVQQTEKDSYSTNVAVVDPSNMDQLNNDNKPTYMDRITLQNEHGDDNSITNQDENEFSIMAKDNNNNNNNTDKLDKSIDTITMLLPTEGRECINDKDINTSTVANNLFSMSATQCNQGVYHTEQEDNVMENTFRDDLTIGTTIVNDDIDSTTLQTINNNVMIQQQHVQQQEQQQQQQQYSQNKSNNEENNTKQHNDVDSSTINEECKLEVEDVSQCLLIASPNGKTVPINTNNNNNNNICWVREEGMDEMVKSGGCGESSGCGETKSTMIRDDVSNVMEHQLQHVQQQQQQQQRNDQSNEDYDDDSTVDPADEEKKYTDHSTSTHDINTVNVDIAASPCCIVNNINTITNDETDDNNKHNTTSEKLSAGIVVVDMAFDNSHIQQHTNTDQSNIAAVRDKSNVLSVTSLHVVEQSMELQCIKKTLLPDDEMNYISVSTKSIRNDSKRSIRKLSTSVGNQHVTEFASDNDKALLVHRFNEEEVSAMKIKETLLDSPSNKILSHNSDIVNNPLEIDQSIRSEIVPEIPKSDDVIRGETVAVPPEMSIVGISIQKSSNSLTTNELCNDDLFEKEQCEETAKNIPDRVDSPTTEKTASVSSEQAVSSEMNQAGKFVSVHCDDMSDSIHQHPDPLPAEQSASSEAGKIDEFQKASFATTDNMAKFTSSVDLPVAEMSTPVAREETTSSPSLATVDIVVGRHRRTFKSKDSESLTSDKVPIAETKSESASASRKRRVVQRSSPIVDNDDSISLNQSTTMSINYGSTTRRKRKADDDTVTSRQSSGVHTVQKRSRIPIKNNIESDQTFLTPLKSQQAIDGTPIRLIVTNLELNATEKKNLKKIGATLLNSLADAHTATHAIITNGSVPIRRTPKLMIAFCRTPNIITLDWLTQSIKARKALSCDKYLAIDDVKAEKQYQFTLSDTIRTIQSNLVTEMYLLSGWSVYVCDGVAGTKAPPIDELRMIIEAADGVWIPNLTTTQCMDRTLIITSDPEVKKQISNKNVIGAVQSGAVKKTVSWLFHCIMTQQLTI